MKVLLNWLALGGTLLVIFYFAVFVASESGEVVVLYTKAADGEQASTRLWVVDHKGDAWLRTSSPESKWLQRLVSNPNVRLERNGNEAAMVANVDAETTARINTLMNEKYGWADNFVGLVFGREDAIAVRLRPSKAQSR